MASWYKVVKRIKGRPYLYWQKTWREGGKVKTKNKYVGPAGSDLAIRIQAEIMRPYSEEELALQRPFAPVNTTTVVAFHGARDGFSGAPRASAEGNLGPGFYLGSKARAERSAIYSPKVASDAPNMDPAWLVPEYDGDVVEFDLSALNMLVVPSYLAWWGLVEELGESGKFDLSDDNIRSVGERIFEAGYDGIELRNNTYVDDEVVVFPGALHKLRCLSEVGEEATGWAGTLTRRLRSLFGRRL